MASIGVRTWLAVLGPPVVIGLIGLTHPAHLTQAASAHWRDLHIVLLPLFPLLAVGPWLVARAIEPVYGRLVLVLGYAYACFYSALDILAGIAAGALKHDREGGLATVFGYASDLGQIGSICFIGATAAAAGCVLRVGGAAVLPGAIVALLGAYGFMENHVYPPWGVLSMLSITAGWIWMLGVLRRARARPITPATGA